MLSFSNLTYDQFAVKDEDFPALITFFRSIVRMIRTKKASDQEMIVLHEGMI